MKQPETHVHHSDCFACRGTDGFYPTTPQHDDCTGKCGGLASYQSAADPNCAEPCQCDCQKPLTRNEVMQLRTLLDHFSKLLR